MVKDYYKILQLAPTANSAEIKAAYRKLALKYHPDKNSGDKYALSQFYLVKEAYETLSSPGLKEEYLKQRWLSRAYNDKLTSTANTPENILHQFLDANTKIHQLDAFRIDKKGIASEMLAILNADNLCILNDFNEANVNDEIIKQVLQIAAVFNPREKGKFFSELKKINGSLHSIQLIKKAENENKMYLIFNRLAPWLIAAAVLFLCVLIFIAS